LTELTNNLQEVVAHVERKHTGYSTQQEEIQQRISSLTAALRKDMLHEQQAQNERIGSIHNELRTEIKLRNEAIGVVSETIHDTSLIVVDLQKYTLSFSHCNE